LLALKLSENFEVTRSFVVDTPVLVFGKITKETDKATNQLRNKVILAMRNTPRSGRAYTKPGGRLHKASSRGNAPAPDTGNLIANIIKDKYKKGDNSFFVIGVGKGAPYAVKLENPKILNRPILRRVVKQELPRIESMLSAVLTRTTDESMKKVTPHGAR
jgi:hypothetical protein